MSYLNGPRLVFAGKFIADVSTVNNKPAHYKEGGRYTADDYADWDIGYWNPYGTGVWRLTDCVVTNAINADGSVAAGDSVIGMAVADADDRPPAKMVDLDPEQQMVSAIWGLLVRLTGTDGRELLRGNYDVASFTDLWWRSWDAGPAFKYTPHTPAFFGASFQSVLSGLTWGDVGGSPFLSTLKAAADSGLLSIKFNVVGYNAGYKCGPGIERHLPNPPDFTTGLLTGTIGLAARNEPRFYTLGRHLQPTQNVMLPKAALNYATAVVDDARKTLTIDLGNSVPFETWRGEMVATPLDVGYLDGAGDFQSLGTVKPCNDWYRTTAGIQGFPLTDEQLTAVASSPVAVTIVDSSGKRAVVGQESADGKVVRADQFVFRMSPGDKVSVSLWATRFGKPLAGTAVSLAFDNPQTDKGDPPTGTPASALTFPTMVPTDGNGVATLVLSAQDPGEPRAADNLDGQVYGVRPSLADATYQDPYDFISVLVWSGYTVPEAPTWEADIQPILVQYANLYPVMLPVLDMGDYDSVCKHLYPLQYAMSLEEGDPNYMPVVRDLSPAKRAAILKWAKNPVRGTPVARPPKPRREPAVSTAAPDPNRLTK
nr:hypothetical protein [Azospirillum picis]